MSAKLSIAFALLTLTTGSRGVAQDVALVDYDATVRAFVPFSDDLGLSWTGGAEPFDDSTWLAGLQGVGFERGSGYETLIGTDLNAAMPTQTTAFVRIPFSSPDPAEFDRLTLSVQYDDGFVAFLNGREVASVNAMPTDQLTWQSAATSIAIDLSEIEIDLTGQLHELDASGNVLAFWGLNQSTTSSDFLIRARLDAHAVIPEPSSVMLVCLGAACVAPLARAATRRRRFRVWIANAREADDTKTPSNALRREIS